MKDRSRKLIVIAKNAAKKRMHEATVKVKHICENLKRRVKDEHFAFIDRTTEKSEQKEFTKKENHLINKFEILKNSTGKKSKQKATSYIKQVVINLTDTELTEKKAPAKFRTELCSNNSKNTGYGYYFGYRNLCN